jgi:GT2 family glycosyltransferase
MPKDRSPKRVDWVSFAAVMIRKPAFESIHGFDERYFMYFEDADVCCRLKKAGFSSFYCADSALVHLGGKSWSSTNTPMLKKEYRRSQLLFYSLHRTWYSFFALQLYLIGRFGLLSLFGTGETRGPARSILTMVLAHYAHRS